MSAKQPGSQALSPILQVGVKVLLLNPEHDYFVGIQRHQDFFNQRKAHGVVPEKYDVPGGRIEFGEQPEAGLRREINEEIGLALPADSKFQLLSAANIVCKPELQIIRITYVLQNQVFTSLDDMVLSDEHQALAWVPLVTSPSLHPLLNNAIEVLLNRQLAFQQNQATPQRSAAI
ncbi:MAG: NUDIX domain-containing protein [Gammaproteobacteria bacterium]|nr:NUDIX domain-containing protein [Gammaproteobacteria bacterium]